MIIGIPRALIYWKQPFFWETFFKNLGFDVILSPETNKEIVNMGVKISDPETCFSNKVYWGHFLWLTKKCDIIFVPRLMNDENGLEYCLRFFALPDLAKILTDKPILTEVFDGKKEKFEKSVQKLGKKLGKKRSEIEKAFRMSLLDKNKLEKEKKDNFFKKIKSKKKKIIIVSHPYNLYDEYVNSRTKEKLEKLGVVPIFIDEVPIKEEDWKNVEVNINNNREIIKTKYPKFHWEFGKEIMEQVEKSIEIGIDGAIQISAYACGCDAVLKEFVEQKYKQNKISFLYLIIDEQTGDAGLQTRLEAFIDTLH